MSAITAFKKFIHGYLKNTKSFDRLMNELKVTKVGHGELTAELEVKEEHTNPMGGLHGGFSATLVDNISSFAINTHPKVGFTTPHVSVDIHTTYMKGGSVGDILEIEAKTLKTGRTLGFLEVNIRNKKTGDLLVKGTHTVYLYPRDEEREKALLKDFKIEGTPDNYRKE